MQEFVIDCGVYVDGRRLPGEFTPEGAMAAVEERGEGFLWLGMFEPDEPAVERMGSIFGLHPLALEDVVHAQQRPKVERYDDIIFLVLKTVQFVPHTSIAAAHEIVETGDIMIFAAPGFVVTVRHGSFTRLAGLRQELQSDCARLALGPFAVVHAIADHVVDSYLEVAQHVTTAVEAIEAQVFTPQLRTRIEPIYLAKRELVEFRRAVGPLGAALQRLITEHRDLVSKEVRRRFRDVIDHQARVSEQIADLDEIIGSLVRAAAARIGMKHRTDLRKLTAIIAIVAMPTAIAALFGMNFAFMPELAWPCAYPVLLAIIVSVASTLYIIFHSRHWL